MTTALVIPLKRPVDGPRTMTLAGVLDARLDGADVTAALGAGARAAASVLRTRHLHPLLDPILGTAGE